MLRRRDKIQVLRRLFHLALRLGDEALHLVTGHVAHDWVGGDGGFTSCKKLMFLCQGFNHPIDFQQENRQVGLDNVPNDLKVNLKIVVYDFVAGCFDVLPWDIGVLLRKLVRK